MKTPASSRPILLASSGAFLIATALLVTVVLPAEYGWDPLGTGARLGLMGMSDTQDRPLQQQPGKWQSDRIVFHLAPFEAVEYKYRMETGAALLFRWSASGEVLVDMHSEPDGAAPGYAESFLKTRKTRGNGSYTAPFPGIHGWFWQNRGREDISITLETSGFYSEAVEMRNGQEFRYALEPGLDSSLDKAGTNRSQP